MFNHLQSLPQATAPIIFVSHPPIFDGKDGSISFLDFAQELRDHSDWNWTGDPSATSPRMEDLLPAHLYGPALRYYEGLHPVLTEDWDRIRDIMAFRFPGPLRSGGLVCRSTTRWEEDGLQTVADTPPPTPSFNLSPSPNPTSFPVQYPQVTVHPQITVHSLYIESDYGGTIRSPGHHMLLEAKIDLDDHPAISTAKNRPLITIASSRAKG
ncbi:hypothetical protein FRC04_005814 [Tulasnella sp. 424]|nr:hypothetical protein FRC04_005814 [Tulasnella sp. 424]KAG8963907.1 hypothetical protein FRC05_004358 [Tulasnella sp. 425]